MAHTKPFSHRWNLGRTALGLILLLCLSASPSFAQQIVTAVHARWDPDLTDTNPATCATSGTVANPVFHFVAAYKYPIISVSVDWVRVEEQPEQHVPFLSQYDNPSGSGGPPPVCAPMLVSDPDQWTWAVWDALPNPIEGFFLHNTTYHLTVQYRYTVITYLSYPPFYNVQTEGPFQQSITVGLQNLVVTSGDERKVLRWDPGRPEACDTSFSYTIACAQQQQCQVKIRIYSTAGELVYEQTEQKLRGTYPFTWDGTANMWSGYPPENIAPTGLYVFDVLVSGTTPYEFDAVKSGSLRVGEHEVEPIAPRLYEARYILRSGKDASKAEVEVYDPELQRITGPTDGPTHAIPESASAQESDWNLLQVSADINYASDQPWRFVFWGKDNFPGTDKGHRQKWSVTNQGQQLRGWFMGFGFQYAARMNIDPTGNVQLFGARGLDATGMPSEIAGLVKQIVIKSSEGRLMAIDGYADEVNYTKKDPITGQTTRVTERLIETGNIGSEAFKDKINRIADQPSALTGIIYYAGHGGWKTVIGIPSNPTTIQLFGDATEVVTSTSSLTDLRRVRLVYLEACKTCADANGTGLVASIASKGAWAVVGFHVLIKGLNNPPGRDADKVFFRTLAGYKGVEGKTVEDALKAAFPHVNPKEKYKQWQDCYGVAGGQRNTDGSYRINPLTVALLWY